MYNKHIQAAALLLLGLLNNPLQAGPTVDGPNTVLEATGDDLSRLDVRLVSKGLKEPVKLQLKGDGGLVVGGVTLSREYPTDYEITAFNGEGKATFSGKGTLPPLAENDRPVTLALSPMGDGDGLVVSLTSERLVLNVQSEKGERSAHADIFDPLGNHKELKFEDIRWGLSDNRYLDVRQFGYDVKLPPKNQEIFKLCPLSTQVYFCLPNGNCRAQKICADPFVQISAGGDHTCALTQSGAATCWGANTQGQLGVTTTGSCSPATTFSSECSRRPLPVVCPAGAPCLFRQISSGQTLTAAIDVNGDAWWWGRGGVTHHKVNAVFQGAPVKFVFVTAGYGHACALSQSSDIWCWGTNAYGESGLPALAPYEVPDYSPNRVLVPFKFRKVVAGGEHTCAIGNTGVDVVCWGRDDSNHQTSGPSSTAVGQFYFQQFGGLTAINDVAASSTSTCVALASGNGVRCWGYIGTLLTTNTSLLGAPGSIAAGFSHLCALVGQTASCMGGNNWGELGIGSLISQTTPLQVKAPPPLYTQISTGDSHTCGLTPGGDAFCWGRNSFGQIGNGTSGYGERSPVQVIP